MMLRGIFVFLCFSLACFCLWASYQWLTEGWGINPFLGVGIALICYWLPVSLLMLEAADLDCELEELLETLDAQSRSEVDAE